MQTRAAILWEVGADWSVEDIELGMRLTRAGGRIRLVKSLEVTHLKQWTFRSLVHTDVVRRAIPWSRLLLAEPRLPDDLNLRWKSRVAAALSWPLGQDAPRPHKAAQLG